MKSLFNTYKERQEKLNALGISYRDYLLSDEWKSIKTKVKNREGRRWNFCNICGADKNLDLHHSSYKVLGQEHPGNTIKPLCRDCHNNLHEVSKKNPTWSFYKVCGRIRSDRKKLGLPVFKYLLNGTF